MTDAVSERILNKLKVFEERQSEFEKYCKRKFDSLENFVGLIFKDRTLIEEANSSVSGLKTLVINHREHIDNIFLELKQEFANLGSKTEDKLDETQEAVDDTHTKIEQVQKEIIEDKKA
jgi:ElaB/YqjD/DUF883 family membrane-anchored ribosome-binding protein